MNDYPNVPSVAGMNSVGLQGMNAKMQNPTLRENIDARVQHYKDEIVRLEKIKEQMPQLLDVNLRDLREAMQF